MIAGSPLCRSRSRAAPGAAAYHPMFRAMFSAVRVLLSSSVLRLVRPKLANSSSHLPICS